jgi:hypothetical protein
MKKPKGQYAPWSDDPDPEDNVLTPEESKRAAENIRILMGLP